LCKVYTYKFSPGQLCLIGRPNFIDCVKIALKLVRFKCFVSGLLRLRCNTNTYLILGMPVHSMNELWYETKSKVVAPLVPEKSSPN
jgi:hypothetical protein